MTNMKYYRAPLSSVYLFVQLLVLRLLTGYCLLGFHKQCKVESQQSHDMALRLLGIDVKLLSSWGFEFN